MSPAQRAIAAIVAVITAVLLVESYCAMVDAAREGGRAIPVLWPLGTEGLALAMEVSVLEAKRQGQRAVLALSWVLLLASVILSSVIQVAVAPPTLVGIVTAGATPVWLLGSFAVLSLLYRAHHPAPEVEPASAGADQAPPPAADQAPAVAPGQAPQAPEQAPLAPALAAEEPGSKRQRVRAAYAALVDAGEPVTGARLAEAARVSPSYGRALLAEFTADPSAAAQGNGARPEPGRAEP
jgi:hypothetical protein